MIDDSEDSHRRRSKRSLVLLAAKIRTSQGSSLEVRLRNLSQNGALLEADTPPPVGSEITFERGETVVDARVAWEAAGRFGITFVEPIQESEVLIHVGKPTRRPEPARQPFRRSGLNSARP